MGPRVSRVRGKLRWARLAFSVLFALGSAACVGMPEGSEDVQIQSHSYGFIDELLAGDDGKPVAVGATLVLPDESLFARPHPGLVLLHTSYGQGSQDWLYAKRLRERGIAVLAVDSFSARGVSHTVRDQTLVSTASMLADAYAGLDYLYRDPRVDPGRIGVMGFSKGGIAAVYSAYLPIRDRIATEGRAFALHVAYYPWCGLLLRQPITTGAPVLIQSGALDDVVPAERCEELAAVSQGSNGPPNMKVVIYPNARHGFDHPMLSMFGRLPLSEPSPAHCLLEEQSGGGFRERLTGQLMNHDNQREILALCSRDGTAGGNAEAAEQAFAQTLSFLHEAGFLTPAYKDTSLSANN